MTPEQREIVRAEIITRFTTNLKRIREAKGVTQEELDEKCGFPQGYIAGVEMGAIIATMGVIETIADAIECTMADLLRRLKP